MPKVLRKPHAVADLESTLVRLVQSRGGVSRVELARELKLVPSTAGVYVDRLLEKGFLLETPVATRGLGRPPVVIQLNPRAGRFIGVDFDAREIFATAVDFAQHPVQKARRTIPARAKVERVLEIVAEAIDEVAGSKRRGLLGIGLGVPGPVDAERGVSLRYAFLDGWRDVPIGPRMADRFDVPVSVENNLRSMALAELWSGAGRGLRNFVCLGVRSGIGSGILVNGQLLRGANNQAGEIGRWVSTDGAATIEELASLTALLKELALPSVAELSLGLTQGNAEVTAAVERAARLHGWVVHQLATLFDPERVIVAGPLAEYDVYMNTLRCAAAELGGAKLAACVTPSSLGPNAGAMGAASLAFQSWKPSR